MTFPPIARWIVPLATLLIAGCAIPPKPELPKLRADAPLAGVPTQASAAWPDADWWKHYRDAQLDALEDKALSGTPSLDEARARFEAAERSIDIARAESGVSVEGNVQYQRQRLSENGLIPPRFLGFTWYGQADIGVQARYDFDFWGRQRAAIEAAVDQARAAQAERAAADLALTTSIASTYFSWQADQARLDVARRLEATAAESRRLSSLRVERGLEPADTLHEADVRIASAREQVAALEGAAKIRLAALAALLGVAPADLPRLEAKPLPAVSAGLPDHASLDLVARRPDVAASRWRVEAALRRADAARAAFYPDLSLSAMAGLSSLDMGKLFTSGSRVFAAGPALHLPIFEGGRLRARFGASKAELDAAAAQYDSAVVAAAQEVATEALTVEQIAARRRERSAELGATEALQANASARAHRGLTDHRAVLAADAKVLEQQDAALALDAEALGAEIALTKALGGGFHAPSPEEMSESQPPTASRTDSR